MKKSVRYVVFFSALTLKKIIRPSLYLAAVLLAACNSMQEDRFLEFQNQSSQQIFRNGEVELAKKNYADAVRHFEALDVLYPYGPHAEQAQLDLIYAYYKNDDYPSAAATAERFIHLYPRSRSVDYAYYMKGLAEFDQDRGWMQCIFPIDIAQRDPGMARQAFSAFSDLLRLYPHSPYAPDARQRMVYLKNLFARHELRVAEFYMQTQAYVAAANRANYILQHYQGADVIPNALEVSIQAYQRMKLAEPARKALDVLAFNYPNWPTLPELEATQRQLKG
ncbi:MAG: outer membrane protein assembly factor BamD [Gammaproteobacteria bacterium]|nr:outer membrane protein assembly factor BamD [Gammaproteobacteria bacterium]